MNVINKILILLLVVNLSFIPMTGVLAVSVTTSVTILPQASPSNSGGGGGGGGGFVIAPTGILVKSPNGKESFLGREKITIEWMSTGDTINSVDLEYTVDGRHWISIFVDLPPTGKFSWILPNVLSNMAKVRVIGRDEKRVTETIDISNDSFSILPTVQLIDEVQQDESGYYGISPVSGNYEKISLVSTNMYIKSPSFSSAYYVDFNLERHPFFNEQIYKTWKSNFDEVLIVTDATLPTLRMGIAMPPKPGVVLVKIQSIPAVYAVVRNPDNELRPYLRWLSSEELAIAMYGSGWADYVIDIDPTQMSNFLTGPDILSANDLNVDTYTMQTRFELSGILDTYDSDNDGLSDLSEARLKTDKLKKDTDGDGYSDGVEVANGYNPLGK